MSPARIPFCVALLLALTAFIPTAGITNLTTVPTTNKPGNITTTVPTTTKSRTIITVQTTIQSGNITTTVQTITKSGTSTATATTAASVTNTSAGIATAALPIGSHFDIGSFVGGILLALGVIAVFYFGRKFCISRSGTRYRTIEETEAII
uniref:porimin isoform X1 n=1 Tax=Pristiophorus japonicus TaxID=55135 RepID=UPI00398F1BC3